MMHHKHEFDLPEGFRTIASPRATRVPSGISSKSGLVSATQLGAAGGESVDGSRGASTVETACLASSNTYAPMLSPAPVFTGVHAPRGGAAPDDQHRHSGAAHNT